MKSHIWAAWNLTQEASLIKKFNFLPSFLDTLILSITLLYQIAYIWIDFFGKDTKFFRFVIDFVEGILGGGHILEVAIVVTIGAVVYFLSIFLIHNIFAGGLIHLIRAYFLRQHNEYKVLPAISKGMKTCLPLIEFNGLLFWAKSLYVVYIFIWGTRFIGAEYLPQIAILAVFYVLLLMVVKVLFAYVRFFIVVEEQKIFQAMGSSVMMAIRHLDTTIKLFFSLLVVYVRIVFVILAMLLLPVIISGLIALNIGHIALVLGLIFIGLVYLLLLVIIAHINSILEIFIETLWFSFYMQNKYLEDK